MPKKRWLRNLVIGLIILVLVSTGVMYGIALWYIQSERSKPLEQGVSFIPAYASSLGVDPQETMDALLGMGVKHFRLVSYWSEMEQNPGDYDFSQLDWQFDKAEKARAKVILTVGLRQPRWPECHAPKWVDISEPPSRWQPQLETFMKKVIERYQDSPSLEKYQLENEYFLKGFGICPPSTMTRQRLIDEYELVKRADPDHAVVIPRSNNSLGFPTGKPQPDEFSVSVYKRVWDAGWTHRYLEYPQPAWFYGWLAGFQKIFLGKNMMIGELQAEAWPPNGKTIQHTSLAEQNKSLSPERLKDRFQYGRATGMREIYLWGAEYWYYRMVRLQDPSLWNVARQEFQGD
ncbi:MAG TPA: hypothetical protein VFX84_03890 [Candidatus Saccharimonadales bacterium]|nr:hypothetical protein [Candidatus Saccharimonadales bacterium]